MQTCKKLLPIFILLFLFVIIYNKEHFEAYKAFNFGAVKKPKKQKNKIMYEALMFLYRNKKLTYKQKDTIKYLTSQLINKSLTKYKQDEILRNSIKTYKSLK